MSIRTKRGTLSGVNCNNSVPDSSQGGSSSDSFRPVEFESLLPQATSAAIATAALFVASYAMDTAQNSVQNTRSVATSDSNANIDL